VGNRVKRYLGKATAWLTSPIGSKKLARILFFFINYLSTSRTPKESLVFLLELERYLFSLTGTESCRYGHGIHSKHRHTHYHDFFCQRIKTGEKVLDIGCGNGALSYDLAKAGGQVTGVDYNKDHILFAQKQFFHPGLELIHGDVLKDIQGDRYDTVVISNVLEHIDDRIGFLKKVQQRLKPDRWLIRVPLYDRDWRVPLMEEIGVDFRLDETHYIEYSREILIEELQQAGLHPRFLEIHWGEVWCEAGPDKDDVRQTYG
jgi:SAM-dependent methyltransferase